MNANFFVTTELNAYCLIFFEWIHPPHIPDICDNFLSDDKLAILDRIYETAENIDDGIWSETGGGVFVEQTDFLLALSRATVSLSREEQNRYQNLKKSLAGQWSQDAKYSRKVMLFLISSSLVYLWHIF